MNDEWKFNLLDEMLKNSWVGVFQPGYSEYIKGDDLFSSRTFAYERDNQCFERTWHHNDIKDFTNCHSGQYRIHEYWDTEIPITQAKYNMYKHGIPLIDTPRKVKSLLRRKRKREKRRLKERAAEEAAKPKCPKCGEKMDKRQGFYGMLWVCSSSPDCQETLKVEKPSPDPPQASAKTPSDQSVHKN